MRVSLSDLTVRLAVISSLVASTAQAQMTIGLNPGTRVRVKSFVLGEGRSARQVARIVAVSADSMVFQIDGHAESVALRRSDVITLEGWVGRQSNAVNGLKYGMAGGAALGVMAVGTSSGDGGEWALVAGMVFGTVGAVGGVVVGALTRSDRWESLSPSEWSSRITVSPTSSRGVAFRVAF